MYLRLLSVFVPGAVYVVTLAVASCGDDASGCADGELRRCPCAGGADGIQQCNAEGVWGSCESCGTFEDAGPGRDSGLDASTGGRDAGAGSRDAGAGGRDAGVGATDGAAPGLDAGSPDPCSSLPTFGLAEDHDPEAYRDATGHEWPGIVSDSDFWSIDNLHYSALSFVADDSSGDLVFEAGRPAEGPPAAYTVKISRCPGDFSRDDFSTSPDTFFCFKSGLAIHLIWSSPTAPEAGACILQPGETYYLNIVHGRVDDSGTFSSNCGASFCSVAMQRTR